MAHLPTDYQHYVYASRYARFLDDKGRREFWPETVARYLDYFEQDLAEHHNYRMPAALRSEVEDAILNLKVMPSMRALMTAGEACRRENLAAYNCLGAATKVLTKEYGYREIGTLRDEWVHVLDGNADWQYVQIRSYGEQAVHSVRLYTKGRHEKTIAASSGHEWVSLHGTRHRTDEISGVMRLPEVHPRKPKIEKNVDYYLGVIHGLVYGDGTTAYKESRGTDPHRLLGVKRVKGYTLVACRDFEDLKPYFVNDYFQCAVAEERTDEKDGYKSYGRFTIPSNIAFSIEMKRLPGTSETTDYLMGFLRGWLCADGHFGQREASLAGGREELDWLRRVYAPLGYRFHSEYKFPDKTNFGLRKKELWSLKIDRRSLSPDDYLVSRMRETHRKIADLEWRMSVGPVLGTQEVFCCEVPTTHSFVIEGGVLTGNCSYTPIDRPRAFAEVLYILMCGTGVGFSVERQVIAKLPEVPTEFTHSAFEIVVDDSKLGWAKAFETLVDLLYAGQIPKVDYSLIRPAGARLKVFGGRASGPDPLRSLFEFVIRTFRNAAGRKLNSLECHEICTKTGEIVVVGGVRRSAEISLSNLSDLRMRDAKSGNWWQDKPHLALANNSVAYTEKPDVGAWMAEWSALYHSRSGERGIFNRHGAINKILKLGRRDHRFEFGTNPCGEIILRPRGLCNLSEAVIRENDSLGEIRDKVRLAAIVGTWQSTQTRFNFVEPEWRQNAEEERLLGVSCTGIYDHPFMRGDEGLDALAQELAGLKHQVIATNRLEASAIGINPSVATTTVKPSGTVSQLVNSPSGIHQGHAPYYIRRVTGDNKDPVTAFMADSGIPNEPHAAKPQEMTVFSFPVALGQNTMTRDQVTAIEHLELVRTYNLNWSEHAVSCTISVREHEWPAVGGWVYDHFDDLAGVSFLPHFEGDSSYTQLPYETISKSDYEEMKAAMPAQIDWSRLAEYERGEDSVDGTREFACVGNTCEIVDSTKPV